MSEEVLVRRDDLAAVLNLITFDMTDDNAYDNASRVAYQAVLDAITPDVLERLAAVLGEKTK